MAEPFDELFQSIHDHVRRSLEGTGDQATAEGAEVAAPEISGTINVPFHLDGNGNYHYEISKWTAGVTVNFTAWITDPEAIYDVTITSNHGGGGTFNNIPTGQHVSGSLKTSFWHSTTITVDLHASVTNQSGNATIEYST